jgi:hypothetical protein
MAFRGAPLMQMRGPPQNQQAARNGTHLTSPTHFIVVSLRLVWRSARTKKEKKAKK